MNEYMEWKRRAMDRTCEKVLKTIDHILEDSNGHLDGEELDRMLDCWKIMRCMKEAQ